MDETAKFNRDRWEELAKAGVQYSLPSLDLDERSAREMVDPEGMLGDLAGKDVLCLAGGGGQQSAAFGILGANVTVFDLSEAQLSRDLEAADHYGLIIETHQGDMRDLSRFGASRFDIVHHAHSISFVPDPLPVFQEVARIVKDGGLYRLRCNNPFAHPLTDIESSWNGEGYVLKDRYVDGAEIIDDDPYWEVLGPDGATRRVRGPREFRHTYTALINGLIEQGFTILGLWEDRSTEADPDPGSWDHFFAVAPPWMTILTKYGP